MDDVRIGRALRALRLRRGLTQRELAALVGVSQSAISLAERGHLDRLSIRTVRRIFAALDARFEGLVTWRGGALDRLLDERHAALVETVVRDLRAAGWEVLVEVSFNHYGDRGSIDVLALHRASRCGVVGEVKSGLTVIEETNRRLDVKVRLAPTLIEERFGVRPVAVGRLLVLPRSTTSFRRVARLSATFDAVLPGRTAEARRWIRDPRGPFAGIAFVPSMNGGGQRSGGRARAGTVAAQSRPRRSAAAPSSNRIGIRCNARSRDHPGS